MTEQVGKHSEEAAEKRGEWLRWHDGSEVGMPPGFYFGGKFAADTRKKSRDGEGPPGEEN